MYPVSRPISDLNQCFSLISYHSKQVVIFDLQQGNTNFAPAQYRLMVKSTKSSTFMCLVKHYDIPV